jgi:DNA-binding MarR family transcriptional regulator
MPNEKVRARGAGTKRTRQAELPVELLDRISAATINFRRSRALMRGNRQMYLIGDTELTRVQVDILEALPERDTWSIGDLSKYLEIDPATVSRTLQAMLELDLIARATSELDRRVQIVSISRRGRSALARIAERRRVLARKALSGVPRERVVLIIETMEEWLALNEAVLAPERAGINSTSSTNHR